MASEMASDVAFAGAAEQARLLADGAVTAPALLDNYLDRINRLNPVLRAYRVVLEDSARHYQQLGFGSDRRLTS